MPDEKQEDADAPVFDEATAEDIKAKFGETIQFDAGPLGAFAFHRPTQAVHEALQNEMVNEKNTEKAQAMRSYVLNCLAYPRDAQDKPDFAKARTLFQAMPEIVNELTSELRELSGGTSIKLKKR